MSQLSQVADGAESSHHGQSDVDHPGRCLLPVDLRLAVLRRSPVGPGRKVLRPVHGRRALQLSSAGLTVVLHCSAFDCRVHGLLDEFDFMSGDEEVNAL